MKIILLPGLDGTGKLFEFVISKLPKEFKPVVCEYPQNESLGYDQLLAYAQDLCPKEEPYLLLGESFSGPIAIRIAASSPPMLKGLILVNTFATCPIPYAVKLACQLPERILDIPPFLALSLLLRQRETGVDPSAAIKRVIGSRETTVMRSRLEQLKSVDVRESASEVEVPVCVIQSVNDMAVHLGARRKLEESLRNPRIHQIPGNHFGLQTHPGKIADIISGFHLELVRTHS